NDGTFDLTTTSPTASFAFPHEGTFTTRARVEDKDGGFTDFTATVVVTNVDIYAVGGGPGVVRVFDLSTNGELATFQPYGAGYTGGVNVAVGDVNNDGYIDLVTGAANGNPHVKVYNGITLFKGTFAANPDGALLAGFFPYALNFNVGSFVAVGDVNGDGYGDIATGASPGNPHVQLFGGGSIANGTFHPTHPLVLS